VTKAQIIERHERQRRQLLEDCQRRKQARDRELEKSRQPVPAWRKALDERETPPHEPQQPPRCYPDQTGWKRNTVPMAGLKIGKLLVIREADDQSKGKPKRWLCICQCGTAKSINGAHLRNGSIISCGCHRRTRRAPSATHGLSTHPLYKVWLGMRSRCENPNQPNFRWYGAKGIQVRTPWRKPEHFIDWALQNGWKPGLVIDRIDPNAHYEPRNCRFITPSENSRRIASKRWRS